MLVMSQLGKEMKNELQEGGKKTSGRRFPGIFGGSKQKMLRR